MIELKALSNNFEPKALLVLYENDKNTLYSEVHKVSKGIVTEGVPLSVDTAIAIKESFETLDEKVYHSISGIIPKNLLYANTDKHKPVLIWTTNVQQVNMYFEKAIGIKNGYAYVPKLLWIFNAGQLKIFALKTNSMNSRIFNAPFFNIYPDGKVCLGNVSIQKDFNDFSEVLSTVQDYFFNSEFTQHLDYKDRFKEPIIDFWKRKVFQKFGGSHYFWNENDLLKEYKQGLTIKDIINEYT